MSDGLTNYQQTGWNQQKEIPMKKIAKTTLLALLAASVTLAFPAVILAAFVTVLVVLGVIFAGLTAFGLILATIAWAQTK